MLLSQEAQEGRPTFHCSLCRASENKYMGVPAFSRLSQLNEHVKNEHDIIMYSTTSVYTKQQILCGRLIKAAYKWLDKAESQN